MYQNYYQQNLGTAGHRATSSYNYMPQYATPNNYFQPTHLHSRSFYSGYQAPSMPYQMPHKQVPLGMQAQQSHGMHQQPLVAQPIPHVPAPQDPLVNGGINSVLEYDLNNMSTFLSWCAFGMLKQQKTPTKDFENLVVSVLFATRLPKSTIVIALEYMNQRFSTNKEITSQELTENEIFVYLIVALLLANKFNDDNTFTNKSWCGATGLQLPMLNKFEKDWLQECKWSLNVVNFESNILTLEECWKTWVEKYGKSPVSDHTSIMSSPCSIDSNAGYSYALSSPTVPYQQPAPIYHQPYSSIPSSPVYNSGSQNTYYYPSSSPVTSPLRDSSIWQQQGKKNSNMWNYTPLYQGSSNFNNDPAIQYIGTSVNHQQLQHHAPHPNMMAPHHLPPSNFVGYSNPYFNYNMAC